MVMVTGYWLLSRTNIQLSILNENIVFLCVPLTQMTLYVSYFNVANQYRRQKAHTEHLMFKDTSNK